MIRIFAFLLLLCGSAVAQPLSPTTLSGNETWSCGIGGPQGPSTFCTTSKVAGYINQSGLSISQALTGTPSSSSLFFPDSVANYINITSDNVAVSSTNFGYGFEINHTYGGAATTGGRNSFGVFSKLSSPTSPTNPNRNYVGSILQSEAFSSDNGTDTGANAKGAIFGFNPVAKLHNGATNFLELTAGEANVSAQTGSSVKYKNVISLVGTSSDAVQGAVYDTKLAISDQAGAVGSNNAILIGNMNGQAPVVSGGTLIATTGSATVTNGIDLSSYTYTGNAFKSNAFTVDGNGNVTGNQLQLPGSGVSPKWIMKSTGSDANAKTIQFGNNIISYIDESTTTDFTQQVTTGGQVQIGSSLGANCGNFVQITGRANGNSALITAQGCSDANTQLELQGKTQLGGVKAGGHLLTRNLSGTTPTVSTCGTGTVTSGSTDNAGQVTATGATACTVTFNVSYTNAPFCTVSDNTTANGLKVTLSAASFTVSGLTSGDAFSYICIGQTGG